MPKISDRIKWGISVFHTFGHQGLASVFTTHKNEIGSVYLMVKGVNAVGAH
jgi:hypothetical protein